MGLVQGRYNKEAHGAVRWASFDLYLEQKRGREARDFWCCACRRGVQRSRFILIATRFRMLKGVLASTDDHIPWTAMDWHTPPHWKTAIYRYRLTVTWKQGPSPLLRLGWRCRSRKFLAWLERTMGRAKEASDCYMTTRCFGKVSNLIGQL